MKRKITMDADELVGEFKSGDLMQPPGWDYEALDEVKTVTRKGKFIEIKTRRASWTVHESSQVEVTRL